jgi:leucine dehydrogenase
MSLKINEISVKGYEKVLHATNETTKLDCIISIHNTKLGPALGGVRSWSYNSFDEQKADALKLSEAMTLKNSICGINFGGGKAVLNLKNTKKTPGLYQSYAEVVEALQGDYFTAGDVNTFKEDLIECSKVTKYVYGINVET